MPEPKKQSTRAALIRVATDLFAQKGYHGTSVREITQAVNANIAAINYHFGDKAGLYREVMMKELSKLPKLKLPSGQLRPVTTPLRVTVLVSALDAVYAKHRASKAWMLLRHEELRPSAALGDLLGRCLEQRHALVAAEVASLANCDVHCPAVHHIVKTLVDALKGYHQAHPVLHGVGTGSPSAAPIDHVAILSEQLLDLVNGLRIRLAGDIDA